MPKEISLPGWRLLRVAMDLVCGLGAMLAAFWFRIAVPLPFTSGLLPADRLEFFAVAIPLVLLLQNATLSAGATPRSSVVGMCDRFTSPLNYAPHTTSVSGAAWWP